MSTRIVCFPQMGNYYTAIKATYPLFGDEALPAPKITKHTLEVGAKYSPQSACIPFKYSLGGYIEALEAGANVLVQVGGGCQMGFYGEIQKVILQKLGYEFDFIKLTNIHNLIDIARHIKQIHPHLTYLDITLRLYLAYEKARLIEIIEDIVRANIGFEVMEGTLDRLLIDFVDALDRADSVAEARKVCSDYQMRIRAVKLDKPENPLKVGIIGEFYVVLEPFSNFYIERILGKYGLEIHRFLTVTGTLRQAFNVNKHIRKTVAQGSPYILNDLGAHGTMSVADAQHCAKHGYAGAIHVKPFACMPEIAAMPALRRIAHDYQFPILYFSFDTLTSETDVKTRLDAFYAMLAMKQSGMPHKASGLEDIRVAEPFQSFLQAEINH